MPETGVSTSLLDSKDLSQYLLNSRKEIRQLLSMLIDRRVLLTVHLPDGGSFVTALLAVFDKDRRAVFDRSQSTDINQLLTTVPDVMFSAALDGVRIQFQMHDIRNVRFEDSLAFWAPIPDQVLRLQRREFYRLAVPIAHPLPCTISHPAFAERMLRVRVLTISGGGVGLVAPLKTGDFSVGQIIQRCEIELPESGILRIQLEVRNLSKVRTAAGVEYLRIGCRFNEPSEPDITQVQRYIFKVERDRRARELGR